MGAITAELVETGERRDTRGRRVVPAERRAELVRAFRASGATMAAFAKREGIKYPTFAGWVMKAQRSAPAKSAIKFTEVRLPNGPGPHESAPLEVRLPDGTVLRGSSVADVAALVRALRN